LQIETHDAGDLDRWTGFWDDFLERYGRANTLLEIIDALRWMRPSKTRMKGEALILRA